MFVSRTSAYQQLQDWRFAQKAITDNLIGSRSASNSAVDYSSAFTGVASGYYTSLANLSAQSALGRIQRQIQTTMPVNSATVALDAGANAAKTAGSAVLAQLG